MVFQNYALFPHMTVAENLAFPLKVRGMSASDVQAKVQRALEMVRLPQMGGRRPLAFRRSAAASRSPAPWCSNRT